ncbi:APC family permease [Solirubrobacter ginsenosidimutans]|uniref:APC family permease n=1 Tax=Solirubrobacter ginsenosidimutans TaxID=490573 RepID=A0A9X3RZP9_9ACTN|nr:APC family permease [Solirubrobacter ginsenosidimutans]MDA0159182.1 APC family permease [Solirubrobacter ginsenosidimutans]
MSQVVAEPIAAAPAPRAHGALAKDALGLPAVLFCIVTGAAPLAAMMFNVPVAVSGGGYAVPAAFLVATIALTIFSTGYIEMSRRVTSTGGFYTFISRGLGNVLGLGSGVLIALCYVIFAAAVTGVLGYFASTTIDDWFGISLPAYVYMFGALALMTGFAWFHIELTAKILGVALVAEVLALLAMCIGIIVNGGGPDGYSAAPLNPANIFDNEAALKVFGAAAAGVAIFGAFWSWVGFEMAPNYAEESREPRKIAKAATYGSVVGLGIFYIFVSYMFVTGYGLNGSAQAVADQFAGKTASAFYPLTDQYVGSGLTTILQLLIVTSSFACAMAFYNTGARYLFALAREGVLPSALGKTHAKRHGPVVAAMVVSVIVGLYMLGFTIMDSSTEAALLKLGTWTPLLGVLGILAVQGLCSVAIIRFFLTEARDGFHWFKTLVAPIIGTLAMAGACYLLIANRGVLSGAGDALFIKAVPWVVLVVFAAGMVLGFILRSRSRETYAKIGRFSREEIPA